VLAPILLAIAAATAPPAAAPGPGPTLEASGPPSVVARLARPVLAMAFASSDRVLLLEDDRVSFWKLNADSLSHQGEVLAPAPVERTRRPGGLLRVAAGTPDFWVLRTGWPEALLFTYQDGDGGVWVTKGGAEAIPWPLAPNGLRFRPGTNVIEGTIDGLTGSSFLALSADGAVAVDADNLLHHPDGGVPLRVGAAAARPWADVALTASPTLSPPDSLLAIRLPLSAETPATTLARLDGRVEALTTFVEKDQAVVLVAIETPESSHVILRLDVRRHAAR
jgi:hypothetical protein